MILPQIARTYIKDSYDRVMHTSDHAMGQFLVAHLPWLKVTARIDTAVHYYAFMNDPIYGTELPQLTADQVQKITQHQIEYHLMNNYEYDAIDISRIVNCMFPDMTGLSPSSWGSNKKYE